MLFYAMKKIFLMTFLFISLNIYAQQLIGNIEIEGLKRTKNETIKSILKIQEGDPWNPGLVELLEQRILQAGIFQPDFSIEIQQRDEYVDLKILVKDKWTLLPIPFFSLSEGEASGGIVLVESNASGRQHLAVLTSVVDAYGGTFFGLYRIPRIWDSSWDYLHSLSFDSGPTELLDRRGVSNLGSFNQTSIKTQGRFAYNVNDALSLGGELGYKHRNLGSVVGFSSSWEEENLLLTGLRLQWDNRYIYPLFSQGIKVDLHGGAEIAVDDIIWSSHGKAFVNWVPYPWVQGQIFSNYFVTSGNVPDYLLLGKAQSHRTLPDESVAASTFVGGDASLEFRMIKFSFGSLTIPVYVEGGNFSGLEGDDLWYWGLGGGFRFYVDKVAVPAMGLDYQFNLNSGEGNFTFSIGQPF